MYDLVGHNDERFQELRDEVFPQLSPPQPTIDNAKSKVIETLAQSLRCHLSEGSNSVSSKFAAHLLLASLLPTDASTAAQNGIIDVLVSTSEPRARKDRKAAETFYSEALKSAVVIVEKCRACLRTKDSPDMYMQLLASELMAKGVKEGGEETYKSSNVVHQKHGKRQRDKKNLSFKDGKRGSGSAERTKKAKKAKSFIDMTETDATGVFDQSVENEKKRAVQFWNSDFVSVQANEQQHRVTGYTTEQIAAKFNAVWPLHKPITAQKMESYRPSSVLPRTKVTAFLQTRIMAGLPGTMCKDLRQNVGLDSDSCRDSSSDEIDESSNLE